MFLARFFSLLSGLALVVALSAPVAADAATRKAAQKPASTKKIASKPKASAKASAKAKAKAGARSKAKARKVSLQARPAPEFDREGNPLLRSAVFFVQDLETGRVLLERNASMAQPIASITKLMTAMVVLDAGLDLHEELEISNEDVDRLKGTSSHLPVGTRLTRDEMLRLALMASENRAASALGRTYPGGLPAFLDAMNHKAEVLGLYETRFYDSVGLNKNNVASARDLARLTTASSHYELIREYSTLTEYAVPVRGRMRTFHNTNALVRSGEWQIDLSKTGYISESGKCLVMQAMVGSRPTVIVLLDASGSYTRVADAKRIRKWVESLPASSRVASLHGSQRVN